jgi:hypothetical protein
VTELIYTQPSGAWAAVAVSSGPNGSVVLDTTGSAANNALAVAQPTGGWELLGTVLTGLVHTLAVTSNVPTNTLAVQQPSGTWARVGTVKTGNVHVMCVTSSPANSSVTIYSRHGLAVRIATVLTSGIHVVCVASAAGLRGIPIHQPNGLTPFLNATSDGAGVLTIATSGGAGISGAAVGNAVWAGGNLTFTPGGGGGAPDAPAFGGKPLLWDFDYGAEAVGALGVVPLKAGSEVGLTVDTGGGAPTIITMANGRKAMDLDGVDDWARMSTGFNTFLNSAPNVPVTFVGVVWRDVASVTQGVMGWTKGINSGSSLVNRYDMIFSTSNAALGRKADGSGTPADANGGTPSLVAPNILIWSANGNPAATQTRIMNNGGAKGSSAALSVTASPVFEGFGTIGARMLNVNATTRSDFLNGKIERMFAYSGALSDAEMDTLQTALAAYYVA